MKSDVNIWKSVKTLTLLCVVLMSFIAKGAVEIQGSSAKKDKVAPWEAPESDKRSSDVEDKNKFQNNKSEKDKEDHQVTEWSFEATLSVFTVEFDHFDELVPASFLFIPTVDNPVDACSSSNIKVLATRYFRLLFSKILPINAP